MIEFCKYHGLGNDFILIDNRLNNINLSCELIVKMCNRNFGIGADGIILIEESQKADMKMIIYNSDGSNPNMCGNGIRCFAKYVYDNKLVQKTEIDVETGAGIMRISLKVQDDRVSTVKVNMGSPDFNWQNIPCTIQKKPIINEPVNIDGKNFYISSLLMGVPHTVVFINEADSDKIEEYGKIIENSPLFPQRTNVNFVKIINRKEIELSTWERGAGYTYACGTGACASVVASVLNNYTDEKVLVHLRGGDLNISWTDRCEVFMEGPAAKVFSGFYNDKY